jgi:hypothetical protein
MKLHITFFQKNCINNVCTKYVFDQEALSVFSFFSAFGQKPFGRQKFGRPRSMKREESAKVTGS